MQFAYGVFALAASIMFWTELTNPDPFLERPATAFNLNVQE